MDPKQTSKFLSLILRHTPEVVGLELDTHGWINVDILLNAMNKHGHPIDRPQLEHVVFTNNKKRFTIDGDRIRANQGHSLVVDLNLQSVTPPAELFHGTSTRFLELILEEGLKKMNRQHVHLSSDKATARKVGMRHGVPVVLRVDSMLMAKEGFVFNISDNGVWLVDHVPCIYIKETIDAD